VTERFDSDAAMPWNEPLRDRPVDGADAFRIIDANFANGATWLILKHEPYFDPNRDLRKDRDSTISRRAPCWGEFAIQLA
jgi:hypothetical protein